MSGPAGTALSRVTTNEAVVTGYDGDQPYGVVENGWGESPGPPMVLVTLRRSSRSPDVVRTAGIFAVKVLGDHQRDLTGRFARREDESGVRFRSVPHRRLHGAPVLDDCIATLVGRIDGCLPFGAYEIVAARVEHAEAPGVGSHCSYFDNAFRAFDWRRP